MKKLILILLLIPSLCMAADPIDWSKPYARMGVVTMGAGAAAAPTCNTDSTSCAGATGGIIALGESGYQYVATKFVATGNDLICGATVQLSRGGTGQNVTAAIYSHDTGNNEPESLVGTASNSVTGSGISDSEEAVAFSGMSAQLTSGDTYWLVMITAGTDATNHLHWHYGEYDACTSHSLRIGTWTNYTDNRSGRFTLKK